MKVPATAIKVSGASMNTISKGMNNIADRTLKDELAARAKDNVFGFGNFGVNMFANKSNQKFADNSLICDADGNCMLKDNLAARYGASERTWTPKLADNSLTCDANGNCMLIDELSRCGEGKR